MKHYIRKSVACLILILGLTGIILVNRTPFSLEDCPISPYEIKEYLASGQYYIVASYPIDVHGDEIDFGITDYVVEKKDANGNYRTVYDSSRCIIPINEALVTNKSYSHSIYLDMTLQPLVDIYGDGEYRVLQLGKDEFTDESIMIAKEYFVVSGEHLTNKDTFGEVFQITKEDLQNIEIHNQKITFDLTEEEKEKFINIILNMRLASMRTESYNLLVLALRAGNVSYIGDYTIVLNLPNGTNTCIYSKTGKDLDGNSYQAIFSSKETMVCLDCDEKLLPLLDALKQKYKSENP